MSYLEDVFNYLKRTSPAQTEFYQAAEEVLNSLQPVLEKYPQYRKHKIIERIVEPERQIMFRVNWVDDNGEILMKHWVGVAGSLFSPVDVISSNGEDLD